MKTIKIGSKCNDVNTLQNFLGLQADGVFSQATHDAVVEYQKKNGLQADGIVGKKTWAKIMQSCPNKNAIKCKRRIDYIVIHCSDTPEGRNNTIDDIRRWHTTPKPNGNGWSDIGYNYVIHLDGSIHKGRDLDKIPAHCEGYNANSIGICYIGGREYKSNTPFSKLKPKDTRTVQQKKALQTLLCELRESFPNAKIVGHKDLDKHGKTCPNFNPKEEYKNI